MEHNQIILIADPRILAIDVKENADPLIDIKNQNIITIGPSPEIPNNTDYTKMRKPVYEKLVQAQKLLPKGLSFCLYEAYRSLSLQQMLFENRYKEIKNKHVHWSEDQVFDETIKMVSPVTNKDKSKNIPPHSTGAAVDVYLIDENGEAIDMGIHPKDWMLDTEDTLSITDSQIISEQAKKNRKIMSEALSRVDFVNYPTEYWHWSYGDRYWAYFRHQAFAIYDTAKGGDFNPQSAHQTPEALDHRQQSSTDPS